MSLYNMLHGVRPAAPAALFLLQLEAHSIERIRDAGIDIEQKEIWVLARTGGGNRKDYPNASLTSHPSYLRDYDEKFDSTFAVYHFTLPEDWRERLGEFNGLVASTPPPDLKAMTDAVLKKWDK